MAAAGHHLEQAFQVAWSLWLAGSNPVDELRSYLLVDRAITAAWGLRRVLWVEVGIMENKLENPLGGKDDNLELAFIRDGN